MNHISLLGHVTCTRRCVIYFKKLPFDLLGVVQPMDLLPYRAIKYVPYDITTIRPIFPLSLGFVM